MKKVLAMLLLTLTVFSLGVNAFADVAQNIVVGSSGSGSIIVSNATIGATYSLYKIFDATVDYSADHVYISYTYNGTLRDNNYFQQDTAGNITIKDAGIDSSSVGIDSSERKYLSTDAVSFLGEIKGDKLTSVLATSNVLTFSKLDYGYYYIESSLGEKAVSVDSTTPDATLFDKNQGPSWTDPEKTGDAAALGKFIFEGTGSNMKRATENSVNIGDTVTFEVSFNATNYVGKEKVLTYYLADTICEGFQIKKDSLKVYFDNVEKKGEDKVFEVFWSNTGSDQIDDKFIISAPWVGTNNASLYDANVVIKVTYDATLLSNAVIASAGNVNTAYYDYRIGSDNVSGLSDPDVPPTTPYHKSEDKTTTTYTYAVGLTKIDGTDKHTLKGANFSIYKGETAIAAKSTTNPGVYELGETTSGTSFTEFKTSDSGVLVIKGLEAGTYTLKETKAPDGYNRAAEGKTFTLQELANSSPETAINYSSTHTFYFDKDGKKVESAATDGKTVTTNYDVNVYGIVFENNRGTVLPITGGMGTTMFYVIGGALVFVALLLLITKNRMHNGK